MRSLLALVSLASCVLAQRFNVQEPVGSFPGVPDLGRNVTTMHLSELGSTDEFTALVHPKFPNHQVRVKKTKFCDLTVKFVSHFLNKNPRHLTNGTTKVHTRGTLMSIPARNICSSISSRADVIQPKVNALILPFCSRSLTCCPVDDVMMWINGGGTVSFRD